MKRLIPIAVLAIGCGSAPIEATDEHSQEVITNYTATNGSTALSNSTGKFCRLTGFENRGGHWSSPAWPSGAYKNGALISVADGSSPGSNGTMIARPYGGPAQPPQRTSTAYATCAGYSDYGFGPSAQQSAPVEALNLIWNTSHGDVSVTGQKNLNRLSALSFCYLNGFDSVSDSGEYVRVHPVPGGNWMLYGGGTPKLAGFAKCVSPNRSFTTAGPFRATTTVPTATGTVVSNSFCALSSVAGAADDGRATIYQDDGDWKLSVTSHNGSFMIAEMMCAVF